MTRCESYPPCFGTIYFPTAPFLCKSVFLYGFCGNFLYFPYCGKREGYAMIKRNIAVCFPDMEKFLGRSGKQ